MFNCFLALRAKRSPQALERCRSILNAQGRDRDETLEVLQDEMKRGVRLIRGATHLQVAGAASVLGAKLLDAAIEYLDARWQEASYDLQIESWLCSLSDDCRMRQVSEAKHLLHLYARQRHGLDRDITKLLDQQLPRPDWQVRAEPSCASLCGRASFFHAFRLTARRS